MHRPASFYKNFEIALITAPAANAIVKLSSTGSGKNSMIVAENAPKINTAGARRIFVKASAKPIAQHVTKNAKLPSMLLSNIFFFPCTPTIPEAASANIENSIAVIAISLRNNNTVIKNENKKVVVVNNLFFSVSNMLPFKKTFNRDNASF